MSDFHFVNIKSNARPEAGGWPSTVHAEESQGHKDAATQGKCFPSFFFLFSFQRHFQRLMSSFYKRHHQFHSCWYKGSQRHFYALVEKKNNTCKFTLTRAIIWRQRNKKQVRDGNSSAGSDIVGWRSKTTHASSSKWTHTVVKVQHLDSCKVALGLNRGKAQRVTGLENSGRCFVLFVFPSLCNCNFNKTQWRKFVACTGQGGMKGRLF